MISSKARTKEAARTTTAGKMEERIVLIDNTEARREDLVTIVLQAFKDMGGSDEELAVDRCRLDNDPEYFYKWVVCLPNWCPKWYD